MLKAIAGSTRSTRRVTLLATVVIAGLALTGCAASTPDKPNSSSGDTAVAPDLQKILDSGELKVGSCYGSPPWAQLDKTGKAVGFDIDVAAGLAKFIGVKLNSSDISAAGRVPALQSGKLDVVACSFTITPARQAQIDFSDPTIKLGWSLIVAAGNTSINSVQDMTGKNIAVTRGGLGVPVIAAANPKANQHPFDNTADALLAVKTGQADGLVDLAPSVSLWNKQDPTKTRVAINGTIGSPAILGVGIGKNHPGLLEKINAYLKEFHATGEGIKLYEKWFGEAPTNQFDGLEK